MQMGHHAHSRLLYQLIKFFIFYFFGLGREQVGSQIVDFLQYMLAEQLRV